MRRFFASLMSVLLIGVFMICPAFAASSFPDVDENAAYAEAVEYLNEIGIMQGDNNGNFNPDKNVTRAEMAVVICRMLGEDTSATDGTVFSDVPANHWANGFIIKAAELGIVSGYGNGKFGPSDTLTYEQAVTMLVRAVGMDATVEQMGGYPHGFLAIATEKNLLTGIDAQMGMGFSRANVAKLLYNYFNINV